MKKKETVRYPWKRWLAKRGKSKFIRGRDYGCEPYCMAQQFRNAAQKLGISLSIHITGKTLTVVNRGRNR
jgi:hypothetical protein